MLTAAKIADRQAALQAKNAKPIVDTFALSQGYSTKSNCTRAMNVFAGTHLLGPGEFSVKKIGKLHHFQRDPLPADVVARNAKDERTLENMAGQPAPKLNDIPRGLTSPAPKKVNGDISAAIAIFDESNLIVKVSQADRKAAWDKAPPRQPAILAKRIPTEQEAEMAKKISAVKKPTRASSKKPAPKPARKAKPARVAKSGPAKPGRKDEVIAMMKRAGGVTIAQIEKATGMLPHSARALISGIRKMAKIATTKDNGTTNYKIA